MDRWIRFLVVLVVLVALLGVGTVLLVREMGRTGPGADPSPFVNATYEARVGDWVEVRRSDEVVERRRVIEQARVDGREVRTTREHLVLEVSQQLPDGSWRATLPQHHPRVVCGLGTRFVIQSLVRDDIEVAGRKWRAWKVKGHYPGPIGSMTAWITDEHPLALLRLKSDTRPEGTRFEFTWEYVRHGHDGGG